MAGAHRMDTWREKWQADNIRFHMPVVNPNLEQWYHRAASDDKPVAFLVPLCGKTLDMMWLYTKGHTVIGIEGVEKAITDFFTENNLEFTKTTTEAGNLFQTADGRMRLYQADLCELNPQLIGPVQAIWDRGSYVAITRDDRPAYCRFMRGVMAPGCRWLLWAVEYDTSRYAGPPCALTETDIKQDLDEYVKLECLGRRQRTVGDWERLKAWNLEVLDEVMYLITPK
ncbi:putative thiopurine S-methyltransferase [Amphibalanus amphitrite]|uniref:thiopurine S-methyltransferase n=1 Tax=Amphibalanus amphitrite TaxID=1232801 RepID=A0A6A4WZD6_AMPAM|nr:putative thiopurine S-methyltransferase [Amphibalanus amphitrite]